VDGAQGVIEMPGKKKKPDEAKPTFNISGKIEAGMVNVGGQQTFNAPILLNIRTQMDKVTQTIGELPGVDREARDELIRLVGQLKALLEKASDGKAEEAETVVKRVEALVKEAGEPDKDKEAIQITGESLKRAAENLAGAMPAVLTIATQIVAHVLHMAR
jgi:ElaB/YqjD/DUF883 family membrane-anchored ribosome-binding protein